MITRWMTATLVAVLAVPLGAQAIAPVTMPAGAYVIQTRDTSAKAEKVGLAGLPFVLKGSGDFTITTVDTLYFTGKLVQKDGVATYTDMACNEPGIYYVRKEGNGYAFDVQSETCSADLAKLLFVPGKPKK
jgi:hypothetical protein